MYKQVSLITRGILWLAQHPRDILIAAQFGWNVKLRRKEFVVLLRPVALGDMICMLASVPALRDRHPNAWFALVSPPGCWQVAAASGLIDVAADRDSLLHKLAERARSASACTYYRPLLPDEYRPRRPQTLRLADEFGRVFGVTADLSQVRLQAPARLRRRLARRLRDVNPERRPVLVLHPGPTWRVREWPAERWQELVGLVHSNTSFLMIRIGLDRPGQLPPVPPFPGVIDWTNQLNVIETVALLEQADALVAIESGPLHIAGVLGMPALGLFGPIFSELRIHPRARLTAVSGAEDCLGCHHASDGPIHWETGCPYDIACMRGISAETVLNALLGLYPALTSNGNLARPDATARADD